MSLAVIGAGVGRTGTYSLKLALERLGFGPCHHMEEVLKHAPVQVPLWTAAAAGKPDWKAIFEGYASAVDWPTASFWPELSEVYPEAKFILTTREPERWEASFSATIQTLMQGADDAPEPMRDWFAMATPVLAKAGFEAHASRNATLAAFRLHDATVRARIPPERLLVYEVKQGWGPLCDFLGVDVPDEDFPRTNDREEFWDRVKGASG